MEQINLYVVLGGLLVLALFSASLFKRYQEPMAEKSWRIQRLLRGVETIERFLLQLDGGPLQPVVERVLCEDVLKRYQRVREIHC